MFLLNMLTATTDVLGCQAALFEWAESFDTKASQEASPNLDCLWAN